MYILIQKSTPGLFELWHQLYKSKACLFFWTILEWNCLWWFLVYITLVTGMLANKRLNNFWQITDFQYSKHILIIKIIFRNSSFIIFSVLCRIFLGPSWFLPPLPLLLDRLDGEALVPQREQASLLLWGNSLQRLWKTYCCVAYYRYVTKEYETDFGSGTLYLLSFVIYQLITKCRITVTTFTTWPGRPSTRPSLPPSTGPEGSTSGTSTR